MQETMDIKHVEHNLKAGVITLQGFIGKDHRDLTQIIDEDESIVQELNVTYQAIADKMNYFRDAGEDGLGEFINVDPHFAVRVSSVRGDILCPYEDGMVHKFNTTVKNLDNHKEITYTDINTHLIEKHKFFQGKGAVFRLDPRLLVEVLEVEETEK